MNAKKKAQEITAKFISTMDEMRRELNTTQQKYKSSIEYLKQQCIIEIRNYIPSNENGEKKVSNRDELLDITHNKCEELFDIFADISGVLTEIERLNLLSKEIDPQ